MKVLSRIPIGVAVSILLSLVWLYVLPDPHIPFYGEVQLIVLSFLSGHCSICCFIYHCALLWVCLCPDTAIPAYERQSICRKYRTDCAQHGELRSAVSLSFSRSEGVLHRRSHLRTLLSSPVSLFCLCNVAMPSASFDSSRTPTPTHLFRSGGFPMCSLPSRPLRSLWTHWRCFFSSSDNLCWSNCLQKEKSTFSASVLFQCTIRVYLTL